MPRSRSQDRLRCRKPNIAFGEGELIGSRFQDARTTKIGERSFDLFQFGFCYRARKIKVPIERRPWQCLRRNRNRLGKIALAIIDRRDLLRVSDSKRTGPELLRAGRDHPRAARDEQDQANEAK